MKTGANRNPRTARRAIGALQGPARAAGASAAPLLPLCLMLTSLVTGCLVVPIPANRPGLGVRTNVTPQTLNQLGADVSRTSVLLQLGEPDEVSPGERQFSYRTERIKCDVFWVLAGGYNADFGVIEAKKYYDLVLRFDGRGRLVEGSWLDGWLPGHLRQRARWGLTSAPAQEKLAKPARSGFDQWLLDTK
jgi:hypothetical protein